MAYKPEIGEKVRVSKFRTMPGFVGEVIEKIGSGWNIKHPDGTLWFRDKHEIAPLKVQLDR